ncbi:MAG: hypothetical protein JSV89_00590 [Spirochaetaceae bacterium]|nr:MAG: hypothetical protein JSV89_00590 [Spirochaetaceae bacterium]
MAFRLKNGVFAVRCRHPRCPFNTQIKIETNIMGATEKDVELEATKIARDMATTKHDAVYGTNHYLENPVIRKAAGNYEPFGSIS